MIHKKIFNYFTHLWGQITGRYYFEDYIRVYPDEITFNRFGKRISDDRNIRNNFLNHQKFYDFVAQFVPCKIVADVGCGSGFGCEIMKIKGAARVLGCDISKKAIEFAENRFQGMAEFSVQGITSLNLFQDQYFDVSVSSEVLEHIKEYKKEDSAIKELKRITKKHGLIIVGTPNSELSGEHGFYFDEMDKLFRSNFKKFCIFENAFEPFDPKGRQDWEKRLHNGTTGVVITENINFSEAVFPKNVKPLVKVGITAGIFTFENIQINTALLHNTHSWVVVAIND
jgi:2-polyprenyl-3-methyl-5-hydroxy-6-metoxy-1,4-benzoquinol methylase